MVIEKNGKNYFIQESKTLWTASYTVGAVEIEIKIPKEKCLTIEELTNYINSSNLF